MQSEFTKKQILISQIIGNKITYDDQFIYRAKFIKKFKHGKPTSEEWKTGDLVDIIINKKYYNIVSYNIIDTSYTERDLIPFKDDLDNINYIDEKDKSFDYRLKKLMHQITIEYLRYLYIGSWVFNRKEVIREFLKNSDLDESNKIILYDYLSNTDNIKFNKTFNDKKYNINYHLDSLIKQCKETDIGWEHLLYIKVNK